MPKVATLNISHVVKKNDAIIQYLTMLNTWKLFPLCCKALDPSFFPDMINHRELHHVQRNLPFPSYSWYLHIQNSFTNVPLFATIKIKG